MQRNRAAPDIEMANPRWKARRVENEDMGYSGTGTRPFLVNMHNPAHGLRVQTESKNDIIAAGFPPECPIPVLLLYWTAEVGEDETVRFRKDIYGRDAKILAGLRAPFTFRTSGTGR